MRLAHEIPNEKIVPYAALFHLRGLVAGIAPDVLAVRSGMPEKVVSYIRGISAFSTVAGDPGAVLLDLALGNSAFYNSLASESILFAMHSRGLFRHVEPRTHIGVVTSGATAWANGEGKPVPLTKFLLENRGGVIPAMLTALAVFTDTLLKGESPRAVEAVQIEMKSAIAAVADQYLLDTVVDSGLMTNSATSDPLADLRTLLGDVNVAAHSGQRLAWWASIDTANRLATIAGAGGNVIFPEMSPTGGTLLGQPAFVSKVIPAGELFLASGDGFASSVEDLGFDVSSEADISVDAAPVGDATIGATQTDMISLFQHHLAALKIVTRVAVERVRDTALSRLTGVNWS